MLERIVTFLILGYFVFVPSIPSWLNEPLTQWYAVYLPWIVLIVACLYLQYPRKRKNS